MQCALCSMYNADCSVNCPVYIVQCAFCSMHSVVGSEHGALQSVTMQCTDDIMWCVQSRFSATFCY